MFDKSTTAITRPLIWNIFTREQHMNLQIINTIKSYDINYRLTTLISFFQSWVSYVVGYCFTRSQPWNRITACGQKRPTTTREQLPHPVYAVRRSLMRCSGQYNFVLSRTMCESETLINFVRNCPILYDTKNKDYKDNAKKAETWANIAIKLHLDNGERLTLISLK